MLLQFQPKTRSTVAVRTPARPVTIATTSEVFHDTVTEKRSKPADPIKKLEDILAVQEYLIRHGRYRDNLLFTMGINVGLRCNDLLHTKVGHVLTDDGAAYKGQFTIIEEKTSKRRTVFLNDAVYDALDLYFENATTPLDLNDYLFRAEGNRGKNSGEPLQRRSVERILKEVINDKCQINVHASTHCLRKTFAFHVIMSAPDRSRAIEFLQKIFGHDSQATTLYYAGITDMEIASTYRALNLGQVVPLANASTTA